MAIITGTSDNEYLEATTSADTFIGLGGIDTFGGFLLDLDGDTITDLEDGERIEVSPEQIVPSVSSFSYMDGVLTLVRQDSPAFAVSSSIFISGAPDGTFSLTTANNYSILTFSAAASAPVGISVSTDGTTLPEDGNPGTGILTLTPDIAPIEDISVTVSITYGTANSDDFSVLTNEIILPVDQTASVTVEIASVIDDLEPEDAETFSVELSASYPDVTFSQASIPFTIEASDQPTTIALDVEAYSASLIEDDTPGTATVLLTPGVTTDRAVTVFMDIVYTTADSSDLSLLTTEVTLPAGTGAASPVVVDVADVIDDVLVEDIETFSVNLSSTDPDVTFSQDAVSFSIEASDQPTTTTVTVAAGDTSLTEDGAPETATLTLTPEAPLAGDASVFLTIAYGTADSGDLEIITTQVTLPADSTAPVEVDVAQILDDTEVEGIETFSVSLSTPDPTLSLSRTAVPFSIEASDNAGSVEVLVSSSGATLTEDDNPETVTLSFAPQSAPASDISIFLTFSYETAGSRDFTVQTHRVTLPAGYTDTVRVDVADVIDDALPEDVETFSVSLSASDPSVDLSRTTFGFSIEASDQTAATIAVSTPSDTLAEDDEPGTATLILTPDAPLDSSATVSLTVVYGTADSDDLSVVTSRVEIPADSTAPVTVDVASIIDDVEPEDLETFSVGLSTSDDTVTLDHASVSFSIAESDQSAPVTVSVSAATLTLREDGSPGAASLTLTPDVAPDEPVSVVLTIVPGTADDTDVSARTTLVTLPAGSTEPVTVAVADVVDDAVLEGSETFSIALMSADSGVTLSETSVPFTIQASDETGPTVEAFTALTEAPAVKYPWDLPQSPDSVVFGVTFDTAVQGVDAGDFTVATMGSASGRIAEVRMTGDASAEVTLDSLSGFGNIGLDLAAGADITSLNGLALEIAEPAVDAWFAVNGG